MPKKRKPSVRKNRKNNDGNHSNYDIVPEKPDDPRFMVKHLQNNFMDALRAELEATKKVGSQSRGMKTGTITKVNPSLLQLDS